MTTQKFAATAKTAVANAGHTAHQGVGYYRKGGEQLARAADKSWNAAFRKAGPQLSAETKKNASHARAVFGKYYSRGLDLSAHGAVVAIDTLVGATITAIDRAAAFKQGYEHKAS